MFWNRRPVVRVLASLLVFGILMIPALWYDSLPMWSVPLHVAWADTRVLLLYAWMLIVSLLVVRFVDRRPVDSFGLGLHGWTLRELGHGLLLGSGMAILAALPSLAGGSITVAESPAKGVVPIIVVLLLAAGEEVLFRGYLFQRGLELAGDIGGVVIFSVLFLAAHLGNPGLTPIAGVNLVLAGFFFGALFVATRSLWSVIGAHASWNILIGPTLGLPLSGIDAGPSVLHVTSSLPAWLSGGAFGPEAGLSTTLALIAGMIVVARSPRFRIAPWTFARTFYAEARERSHSGTNLWRRDGS